ncbi:MAG: HlyD family efflux transporter periplasmic adaptor subunit [Pirellulales bacterium]|nr:HlyD family efflux transporter periplasmic adaptor subunit [Pirellulales bacterium]
MTGGNRIPIPLKHKWRRFRYNAMPILCFIACVLLMLGLWRHQGQMSNGLAEVERKCVPVAAGADGKLVAVSTIAGGLARSNDHNYWALFDRVHEGQVIARLDDSLVRAAVVTLQEDVERLKVELPAAKEKIRVDALGREDNAARHRLNLTVQAEEAEIDVLDRKAQIEADEILLKRLIARLQYNEPLVRNKVIAAAEYQVIELERDEVQKRIDGNREALKEAEKIRDGAQRRLASYSDLADPPEVETLIGPIRAEIRTQMLRIDELNLQIRTLDIVAPFEGEICEIHCWPEQYVRRGDPIVTIAATGVPGEEPRYAIAYVPETQRIRPEIGMVVGLQSRYPGNPRVQARIAQVGPQIQEIPPHLCRDPARPEWGLPVRIPLPDDLRARPGELLDVRYSKWISSKSEPTEPLPGKDG